MGFSLLSVTEILYYFILRIRMTFHRGTKDDKTNLQIVQAFSKRRDLVYPFAQWFLIQ